MATGITDNQFVCDRSERDNDVYIRQKTSITLSRIQFYQMKIFLAFSIFR